MSVLVNGELVLYGVVGDDFWGDGFTATEVVQALAELGRDSDITVRINSGGGYCDHGIAIFNALNTHRGHVSVEIDAIAASAASVIAMAGDTISMSPGALMMIHDPSCVTYGDAAEHTRSMGFLDKIGDLMADIYAERTDGEASAIRDEMRAELWMTGAEAVERGFASQTGSSADATAAAFDYAAYGGAPDQLVAMAKDHKWSLKAALARKAASNTPPQTSTQEAQMGAKPKAQQQPAAPAPGAAPVAQDEKGRIKAILDDPAASGREGLARHLAFDTDMTPEAAVATLQAAGTDAPPEDGPAPDPQAYQQRRSAAADLAQPGGGGGETPKHKAISSGAIFAARRKAMEG